MLEFEEYQEYEITPSESDLQYLTELANQKKLDLIPVTKSKYKIKISSYVGFIYLSSQRIYLKPKIPFASIFFLLSRSMSSKYVIFPKDFPPSWFDVKHEDHLTFVKIFIHILDNFVKHGLRRGYKEREATLNYPQGTLLISKNVRKPPWEKHEFVCQFDEYTYNIFLNQIIKYTVNLLHNSLRDSESKIMTNRLQKQLSVISNPDYINLFDIDNIVFGRQYSHYQQVISYCRLVIGNLSLDKREGEIALSSFLINMNKLYENFVFHSIKQYFSNYNVHKSQIKIEGKMGQTKKILITEPDVNVDLYNYSEKPIFVADAKYKFLDLSKKRLDIQRDFYQILSYALFTKAEKAVLFYPQYRELYEDPVLFILSEYGIEVLIVSLPLGGMEWNKLDKKISEILTRIDDWIV